MPLRFSALAALVCTLLCLMASMLLTSAPPVRAEDDQTPHRLRVLTYNVLHGGPLSGFTEAQNHLEARLALALDEIEALQPDVIALQEASKSRSHGHIAERIARRLGYHVVFASSMDRLLGVAAIDWVIRAVLGFEEGVAVLSRYPITDSTVHRLPRCHRWYEPRVLLETRVSTPWGPLPVFSTHLSRTGCQAEQVGRVVREHRQALPSLLMGDFNAADTRPLTELYEEAPFMDAFRAANPSALGLTVYQRIESARPTVSRRVDYIFLLDGLDHRAAVRSSRVVLDQPGHRREGSTLWPSDHYGVLAEIEIE